MKKGLFGTGARSKSERLISIFMSIVLLVTMSVGLTTVTGSETASAAVPLSLTDLWNGNAHFELYSDRHIDGQSASGSNIVVVNNTWYWFHRKVIQGNPVKLGTVCEKSTDKGQTWSRPVDVILPVDNTAYSMYVTDGSFYYDSANNKWIALMQSTTGSTPWTMSYFERAGSDPMGLFSTPSGFTNPACDAREIWSQLTTAAGKDCVDIPGGTNQIYDEGTPQIVCKTGNYWYVTFHGASNSNGVTHGYRGLAKTADFQNWTALTGDCIVDQLDAQNWEVEWNPGGPIGAGAANIMQDGSYWYQIIECPDTDLNGYAGQNWPLHILRSSALENTKWENCPNTYPILPSTQQLIEWQYPTFFKDSDGTTYLSVTLYAPDSEMGFRIYKLVPGGGPTTPARFSISNVDNPSFESNTSGNWTFGSSSERSGEQAHSGAYSLKISQSGQNAVTNKIIAVRPNTDYTLSGYIYKTNSNGNVYFDLNDVSGDVQPTVNSGSGAGVWTFVSKNWNSGNNTSVKIRCVADNGLNAPAYFDDVSFVKTVSDSFEAGQAKTSWTDAVESSQNVSGYISGINPECSVRQGEKTKTGSRALMFSGTDNSTSTSYCKYKVFDVDIPVSSTTKLSYWFYPEQENGRHVAVDFVCTDGSTLSGSGAVDQNSISMNPANARGVINTWNYVECAAGQWLNGKRIDKILVSYDQGPVSGQYRGYIDDLTVVSQAAAVETHVVLTSGQKLLTEDSTQLYDSSTGRNYLISNQNDGNLVIYSNGTPTWSTNTAGQGPCHLDMQTDGNLVLYKNKGGVVWASNTSGAAGEYYCTFTTQANQGKLKIYKGAYPYGTLIWSN